MNAKEAKDEIMLLANNDRTPVLSTFFKTGKGQYAEGDIFIGVYVGEVRKLAKKYLELKEIEILKLLKSKIHEIRLLAILILVLQFKKADKETKRKIYNFYISNTRYINNWDLVDLSARDIVGVYLYENKKELPILQDLSKSSSLWERRIAIIATYAFIMKNSSVETFRIAKILLSDKEDLIHKATGWMLREVGKRVSKSEEVGFIEKNYNIMSRTTLRYAIEHFSENERAYYLSYNKK